jgi:hypothetical protein
MRMLPTTPLQLMLVALVFIVIGVALFVTSKHVLRESQDDEPLAFGRAEAPAVDPSLYLYALCDGCGHDFYDNAASDVRVKECPHCGAFFDWTKGAVNGNEIPQRIAVRTTDLVARGEPDGTTSFGRTYGLSETVIAGPTGAATTPVRKRAASQPRASKSKAQAG